MEMGMKNTIPKFWDWECKCKGSQPNLGKNWLKSIGKKLGTRIPAHAWIILHCSAQLPPHIRQLVQWRECSCSSLGVIYSRPSSPQCEGWDDFPRDLRGSIGSLKAWGVASSLQDTKKHGAAVNSPKGLEEAPCKKLQVEVVQLSGYYNAIYWRKTIQ